MMYFLLSGHMPFDGCNEEKLKTDIKRGVYNFGSIEWEHISKDSKKFIGRMLQYSSAKRISAVEALNDPWI